jgi:Arm DNA-binding domain
MLSFVAAPQHTPKCCHGAATENDRLAPWLISGRRSREAGGDKRLRKTLTDRSLRSLKPRLEHYDIMDTIIPSMGVRVLKSVKISFTLHGRFPGGGAFTRRALGGYGELTLLEAREKARDWLKLIERSDA